MASRGKEPVGGNASAVNAEGVSLAGSADVASVLLEALSGGPGGVDTLADAVLAGVSGALLLHQ